MNGKTLILAVALGVALAPSGLRAAEKSAADITTGNAGSLAEGSVEAVLADLHRTNLAEIAMGDLAKDRASAQNVKNYAEMLVSDHKQAESEVQDLAEKLGIQLPDKDATMAGREHQKMQALKDKSGAEFDQAYMKMMAEGHGSVIQRLQRAQGDLPGEVNALVAKIIPVLKKHQADARQLARNPQTGSPSRTQ